MPTEPGTDGEGGVFHIVVKRIRKLLYGYYYRDLHVSYMMFHF